MRPNERSVFGKDYSDERQPEARDPSHRNGASFASRFPRPSAPALPLRAMRASLPAPSWLPLRTTSRRLVGKAPRGRSLAEASVGAGPGDTLGARPSGDEIADHAGYRSRTESRPPYAGCGSGPGWDRRLRARGPVGPLLRHARCTEGAVRMAELTDTTDIRETVREEQASRAQCELRAPGGCRRPSRPVRDWARRRAGLG